MKTNILNKHIVSALAILLILLFHTHIKSYAQATIIDHACTDITQIPESAINQAKATLHIAYGHTSHGSQITTGMTGLVSFANNSGRGLSLPANIFAWNNGGTNGALDLHDYAMGGDVGYYPDWVNNTRNYLGEPNQEGRGSNQPDVNVIIWSWCGQAASRTEQSMIDTYLAPMTQLELDYPNITFVYMTGHADGSGESGNLHLRNQQIRNYCIANNKVLYDFYDIECYDPDGTYFGDKNVTDACGYTGGGNWAIEWQNAHTEGIDWYNCSSAHSQPLNANRKAYAAWWLWATLAGWSTATPVDMCHISAHIVQNNEIRIIWQTESEKNCAGFHIWRSSDQKTGFERITTNLIPGHTNSTTRNEYNYSDCYPFSNHNLWYKIEELATTGQSTFYGPIKVQASTSTPVFCRLLQNYPNPFNPITTIQYNLSVFVNIELSIFDMKGEMIVSKFIANQEPGIHLYEWNASEYPSGVYLARLTAKNYMEMKKLILLK
ncbi:T9SS type A sorting domain-containing protein [candidate division KSB1 bacterium]|nr:T9SS type A sorting domain-containing protein [candidate division KSB1 bacterium]